MAFFKTIYKFFFKPKNDGYSIEKKEKEGNDDKYCEVDFSSHKVETKKKPPKATIEKAKEPPKKKIYKKKRKKLKPTYTHKKNRKIRTIDSNEDLYELFTGEKNSGVIESDLSINHKNLSKKKSVQEIIASYPPPEKIVDLHGMTLKEAQIKMDNEVLTAKMNNNRTILFITGKGRHSKGGESVLKKMAEEKAIIFKKKCDILTFRWEKKQKKKSGAIIFFL